MRKLRIALISVLLSLVALVGLTIPASANGTGSCTLSGGTAYMTVNEPSEGAVSYISIRSPVNLRTANTYANLYTEEGALRNVDYFAFASPIDGDGWWNFRINVNYNPPENNGYYRIGRVYIRLVQNSNGSACSTNIYI